ncbi:hypothetical protein F5I97DRAFT_1833050, partial [Phlebopus sp. FC_14]
VQARGRNGQVCPAVPACHTFVVYSRTDAPPYLDNIIASRVYSDQYFSFLWDLEVKRVEYDLDLGQIVSSTPLVIANQTQTNYSSHDQEMSFELDETPGLNITFGTTFKAGVPIVAEAEFSIDFQINNQFTWGQTTEFSESYRATFPVHADQGRPCGQCLR